MRYLANLRKNLPENCLYDKGKIGCGGTSLAIECDDPYVICVPFISLIDNKIAQYPNDRRQEDLLPVDGNTGKMEIKYYDRNTTCPKILVTYDSLEKVVECIDPHKYKILIDEYHLLFNQYSFRKKAVDTVLNNYKKFKSFTFMTATPLEKDFVLKELEELPLIVEEWPDVLSITVKSTKCKNVLASTIKIVNGFLSGDINGNAYLFVNSLEFIKDIYKRITALDESNSRIIYSKSNRTQMPLKRASLESEIKKINFLTSTVFEGADIYDPDGRIIVISDSSKANTLLDISTSIQQIAGRIRNSRYIRDIMHLYSTTRYSDISYKEFRALNIQNVKESEQAVTYFNELPEIARKKITEFSSDTYIQKLPDGTFYYDPNMAKIDLYNYKVAKGVYTCRVNLESEYHKYGINTQSYQDESTLSKINLETESFKDIVIKLENGAEFLQSYKDKYPFLEQAINTLGFKRIKALKYVQKEIKKELLMKSNKSLDYKIAKLLYTKLKIGDFYTPGDIKKHLAKIYSELDIPETPKSDHINKYFECKVFNKRLNNSMTRGLVLVSKKYITKRE